MWRFQFVVVAVALLMVMVLSAAPVQAQSPVEQASQAGFPLLTEFTLHPGGQPFTYTYTDQEIGRLLCFLDEAQLWDSTLVAFVADHVEELGERGWIGHTLTLHDELVHVPLALAVPSGESSSAVDRLVETRWLFGTVLGFLGLPDRTGQASCPSLLRDPSEADVLVRSSTRPVGHLGEHGTRAGKHVWLSCVVAERWKLIRNHLTGRVALFDLAADPAERQDCSAESPAVTSEPEHRLDDWESELRGRDPPRPHPRADPEQLRQLEDLGYL